MKKVPEGLFFNFPGTFNYLFHFHWRFVRDLPSPLDRILFHFLKYQLFIAGNSIYA